MWDVAVLGGGAAGLLAAWRAADRGARVLLLEKNRRAGASKVNRAEAVRSISMILYLGLRNFFGRERAR